MSSYTCILAGTDGTAGSMTAVREAADLAKSSGAELIVVCAFHRPNQSLVEAIWEAGQVQVGKQQVPDEMQWRFTAGGSAQQAIDDALGLAKEVGVEARALVEKGDAADVVVRVAEQEGADLIVVGSRGRSSPTHFLLGSVPGKISHNAPCDLLIVQTDGA